MTIFPKKNVLNLRALTLIELLIIIALIAIFASLIGVPTERDKRKAIQLTCMNNLKQLGLAFHAWEDMHGNQFPIEDYTSKTSSPLYTTSTEALRYFQVLSNQLSDPKYLACRADINRSPATNFTTDLNSTHISYFFGMDANDRQPGSFLAGDSNITNGFQPKNGLLELTTNQSVGWTRERHVNRNNEVGNVVFADGSVQGLTSASLNEALKHTGFTTNRLLFPEPPK